MTKLGIHPMVKGSKWSFLGVEKGGVECAAGMEGIFIKN